MLRPTGYLFSFFVRLHKLFLRKNKVKPVMDPKKNDDLVGEEDKELYVERIRLETMKLRFVMFLVCCTITIPITAVFPSNIFLLHCSLRNLIGKITIQEPTFEEVIVLYR